jgi:hypothetical protein
MSVSIGNWKPALEEGLDLVGVVAVHAEVHAPVGAVHLGQIQVALLEHLLARHLLLHVGRDHLVDEGQALAAVGQQAGLGVAGAALAGIGSPR